MMNEQDLFKLFKSEIEKQGVLEVWTSDPDHFCDPTIEPAIYAILDEGKKLNHDVLGDNWCIPEENIWNDPMSLTPSTRFCVMGSCKKMYKIYDRGEWMNCAYTR